MLPGGQLIFCYPTAHNMTEPIPENMELDSGQDPGLEARDHDGQGAPGEIETPVADIPTMGEVGDRTSHDGDYGDRRSSELTL